MNQSENIQSWLRQLAELDSAMRRLNENSPEIAGIPQRIEAIRALIPTSMLAHYDHLKSRGKRSVAAVGHGFCGSCHLAIPRGRVAELRRSPEALHVCDNCGAFIYMSEEELAEAPKAHTSGGSKKSAAAPLPTRRRGAALAAK